MTTCNITLKAHCKINIGLRVVRRRDDGYHDLQTVMFPVRGLCDTVVIERLETPDIEFEGRGIVVDCPAEKNLCVRAARLMQQRYGVGGMRLTLDKRVPFGAGLGGGSSDATAVIRGINTLYNLQLDNETLVSLAAELGSDTPFFVYNTPMYCTGRGEIMTPIDIRLRGWWLAVAKPAEGVSTSEAYSGVKPQLPNDDLCELLMRPVAEWQGSVCNDFECHILARHPKIAELKQAMLDAGASYASMSGSGSAVFGLFRREPKLRFDDEVLLHVENILFN